MSAGESLSIGVSSFSFNQDVIKLRQCLANTETESSEDASDTHDTSQKKLSWNEENQQKSNDQSQVTTYTASTENCSVLSGASLQSGQDVYLRDHSIEAALVTNEMYQEALREAIVRLEMALVKNLERQSAVQYELDHGRADRDSFPSSSTTSSNRYPKNKTKHWQVLNAPYLKDQHGFPFPENADAKYKNSRNETSPYLTEPQKWTKHEQALLYSAVKLNIKKNLTEPLIQKKEIICSKLKSNVLTPEQEADLKLKCIEINSELEAMMKLSDTEMISLSNRKIDWMKISTIDFEGLHSEECCEIMWENTLKPSIYKGAWTKEEDKKLIEIAKKHHCRDWDMIAKELGSKRTAEQCIKRYNGHLNTEMVQKGAWTGEEDNTLCELIDELRVGDKIPWGKVSSYLESRHPKAVRKHWLFTLSNEIKRGAWSLEEDIILLLGVKKYGNNFGTISHLLPGRIYTQCRERYLSSLSMDLNFEKWNKEEDRKLIRLAKEKGVKWAEIAESLPGRTSGMVRQRYGVILKKVPDAYDRVELDLSQWPLIPTHNNYSASNRRSRVYNYIANRSKALHHVPPGRLPYARNSVNKLKTIPKSVPSSEEQEEIAHEFSSGLINPRNVDFMLEETKNIIKKKFLQQQNQQRRKKEISSSVDIALDSLLLPSLLCKTPGQKKGLSLSGKDSLEHEWCKISLMTALNFTQDKIAAETSVDIDETRQELDPDSCAESNTKKNKFDIRNDYFAHGIQQTILKQCLGENKTNENYSILPPTRPSVNAFKLMVLDRKRVIELASLVEDVAAIQKITETPPNKKPMCALHTSMQTPKHNTIETNTLPKANDSVSNLEIQNCKQCSHLSKLHSSYYKFKNRFISLFFWPGQMYLVPPPEESIDPSPENFVTPKVKQRGRKRKRGPIASAKQATMKNDLLDEAQSIKKPRKSRESKYKNLPPVRSSARQANKPC